ncbi:MAG: polymerase primary sigma factor [Chloroflexota bacterium]|nr:polymerase primary sigma factor [Chloroflexota bacterium]
MAQRIEQRPPLDEEHEIQAQLERYPRLSHEEERRLLSTHGADRDAANRVLIEHNLHLVLEAAQARKGRGVAFGDLFQEGTVGLISAVEHYKPADGAFHARLVHVIAVTMDDVLAQTDEAQRNDEAFVIACRLLESAQRLLSERLDRPATPAELAKLCSGTKRGSTSCSPCWGKRAPRTTRSSSTTWTISTTRKTTRNSDAVEA